MADRPQCLEVDPHTIVVLVLATSLMPYPLKAILLLSILQHTSRSSALRQSLKFQAHLLMSSQFLAFTQRCPHMCIKLSRIAAVYFFAGVSIPSGCLMLMQLVGLVVIQLLFQVLLRSIIICRLHFVLYHILFLQAIDGHSSLIAVTRSFIGMWVELCGVMKR